MGKPESNIPRAVKELKAFRKVVLNAGEEKRIALSVPVQKLAYFNAEAQQWMVEPGSYRFYLGNASDAIVKSVDITVHK